MKSLSTWFCRDGSHTERERENINGLGETNSRNQRKVRKVIIISCVLFSALLSSLVLYNYAQSNFSNVSFVENNQNIQNVEKVLIVTRARSGSTLLLQSIADTMFGDIPLGNKLILFEPDHATTIPDYNCNDSLYNCSTDDLKRLQMMNDIFSCDLSRFVSFGYHTKIICAHNKIKQCNVTVIERKCKNSAAIIVKSINYRGQFVGALKDAFADLRVALLVRHPLNVVKSTMDVFRQVTESNAAQTICNQFYRDTVLPLFRQSHEPQPFITLVRYEDMIVNYSVSAQRLYSFLRKVNSPQMWLIDNITVFEKAHFVDKSTKTTSARFGTVRSSQQIETKSGASTDGLSSATVQQCREYIDFLGYV